MILKILKKLGLLVLVVIVVAAAIGSYYYFQFKPAPNPTFGLTFSDVFAASLGFDAMEMYNDILADLKPKKIRLVAYWDEIEPIQGKFEFKNLDLMLTEAGKRDVDVIMVVGKKVPRWPECHQPQWYNSLDASGQQAAVKTMLKTAVTHLKQYPAIKQWQVENEPYFVFGIDCPKQDPDMLQAEVQTVKDLDSRPVILTGSGEQGNWNDLASSGADVVGVTMYRTVYNDRLGYYKYPIGPWFYRIKAGYLQKKTGKSVVGVELQAEPWLLSGIFNTKVSEQSELMNAKIFNDNVLYAKNVGFGDNYLWGVEWWYWMAKKQNDWGMWAAAKDLLASQQ